jgi:glycerol-3-phosphate acyltransferase PlsX
LSERITIALDAMGGDRAPGIVVKGAEIALQRHPDAHFLLFGVEDEVRPLLAQAPRLGKSITLHHTTEVVAGDAKP